MATDDEDTKLCQTLALGALTGSLERDERGGVVLRPELATRPGRHPQLFVRFPGILKSEYEVAAVGAGNSSGDRGGNPNP